MIIEEIPNEKECEYLIGLKGRVPYFPEHLRLQAYKHINVFVKIFERKLGRYKTSIDDSLNPEVRAMDEECRKLLRYFIDISLDEHEAKYLVHVWDLTRIYFPHDIKEKLVKEWPSLINLKLLTYNHDFLNHIPSFLKAGRKVDEDIE